MTGRIDLIWHWYDWSYLRCAGSIVMISECLHCNSHQQHQFLHLCPWRFPHPGGKRPASDRHQHRGRLCTLFGKGIAQLPNPKNAAHKQKDLGLLWTLCLHTGRCSWSLAQLLLASWLWTTRRTTRCGSCLFSSSRCLPFWWPTASCPSLKTWSTFSSFVSLWTQSTMTAALDASSTWTKPSWWEDNGSSSF